MKQQISRLSPHQNGKVWAVLMTGVFMIILLPFYLIASVFSIGVQGMSPTQLLILPVMYFVVGYAMTALGCMIYNVVAKFTGGIEYEVRN
jgi:hypothetical protein